MDGKAGEALEHVRKLLRDNRPPPLEGDLAEDSLAVQIHEELKTIREILISFSAGDFSPEITIRGIIPGCLKALQAHLRHLVWQVQMVEKGDFTQEVRFMGEFSTAFNRMVRQLDASLSALKQKEETLTALNEKLQGEVEHRTSTMEALRQSEARLSFLANHDPLTGVLNRRSFIDLARIRFEEARELSVPCCLVMMDIDHFKAVNDTYGHLAGDETLRHVVNTVSAGLRKNDFTGRYGGEEFVFFFYNVNAEECLAVVERIRKKIAETPAVLENGSILVCASFGVVQNYTEESGENMVQKLISDADTALYAAKKAGRNRVVLYESQAAVIRDLAEQAVQ